MRAIEVDLDVYKALFQAKLSFDEPDNETLRRLLRIRPRAASEGENEQKQDRDVSNGVSEGGKEFRHGLRRLMLPNGTRLRADYKGNTFEGEIKGGDFVVSGRRYSSFSPALIAEVKRVTGRTVSLNGWIYWHFQKPGSSRWKLASTEAERS